MLSYVSKNVITALSAIGYSVFDLEYNVTTQYVKVKDQSDGTTSIVSAKIVRLALPGTPTRGSLIEYFTDGMYINGNTADNLVSDIFDLVGK